MNEIICGDKRIPLDSDGFLVDLNDWDEDVALALAHREGLEDLDREQFEIIEFLRNYYLKYQAFPILNYVCKNIHEPRGCVNTEFVNPMKAWKIAGLPRLDNIHFVTVDGQNYMMEECC